MRVILFVVPKPRFALDDLLRDRIEEKIRTGASPLDVPARIIRVRHPAHQVGQDHSAQLAPALFGVDGSRCTGMTRSLLPAF